MTDLAHSHAEAARASDRTLPQALGDHDLSDLIGCPSCDALYVARMPEQGERAVCGHCHTVLIAPRKKAGARILALSLATLILVVGALFFPFLEIHAAGFGNRASILDVASSFQSNRMAALSLATAAMIVVVPLIRMVLILYVLTPIVFDAKPFAQARRAFRWSQELKPWAMAEIFALGCAVALVKVADLAQIGFGPAFWMFSALVLIVMFNDNYLCTWSVWKSLEKRPD
ncbi:paraquat-inducible protein A [Roseivivax isoporae]|uniref:Paraquat-inducible protein A n=1 Tax=Roseivivax isoporae LMG 25204 TaxID=1449351 RepID=X7F903_9RHOB|nr:paraquat-inducible protein A [Roseivivax isoporae]ETX28561.1 paraquat-inducible protein A [Roseivivax isoporae LMG 25204]